MTQPIDVTYVELRARGEDDAARKVKRATDGMEDDVERAARNMEDSLSTAFKDAADSIEKSVGGISDTINNSTTKTRRSVIQMGDDIIEVFDDVDDVIETATSAIGGSGGGAGGGGGLLGAVTSLSGQLKGLGGFTPPPILFALAAATPAIIGLVGALADLSALALLLPGAIGVLGVSIAVLTTAFSGLGDAVSALASGDLEKINETMKKLAPAAQAFAREINALREPFAQLRREVQQSFFAPLTGDLTRLANAVLPTLRTGMRDVAASFGELGSALFELFSSNDVIEDLGDLFESTARIVRNITPELTEFLGTLFGVIERSLPFIERAFDKLGEGLQAVSDFLGGALQSGDFEKFLEDAFATMSDLFDLAQALFGLLSALFGGADDEGRSFIQTLTAATERLTAFIESAEGQETLQRTIDALKAMGVVLGVLVEGLIAFIRYQNFLFKALETIGKGAVIAGVAIGEFFQALWGWIQRAGSAIGDFFKSVGDFFVGVGRSIQDGWNAVVNFGGQIVDFIQALPGRIIAGLQALPTMIANFFVTALNNTAYAVGFAIGTIVQFFIDLPGRIVAGLTAARDFVVNAFTTARDQAIAFVLQLVNTVVTFIDELPGRITAGLTLLWNTVTSFFTRTRDAGQARIREMINAVVSFFQGLPGRVEGALNSFRNRVISILRGIKDSAYNIGRDIINGIKNGISDAIEGAVDLARNAAKRIVKGFKDALSVGSPSKLMAAEVGVPIAQGIGLGIQQGTPSVEQEISAATRNFIPQAVGAAGAAAASGMSGAGGTFITFDPGAVQVVFEGVVPTEEEARRTGTAVGQSISQTLQRRNVRTLVRTT